MTRPRPAARLATLLVIGALTACSGTQGASDAEVAGPPAPDATPYKSATRLVDWPTYHRTPDRHGHLASRPQGPLKVGWTKSLDGSVYGEPLVLGSTLVVATERNQVYGLNARTGHVRWRTGLGTPQPQSGLPCGNIDPLGVTGTPAYSARVDRVFVVAETVGGAHTLWALDPATGHKKWHRNLDTQADRNRKAEQQRGATLVVHRRVITTFGGLAGDCDDYVGYVTSVPVSGQGRTRSYAVPTAREGGIWSTPGAVATPGGSVLVASGNGAELGGRWDGSDSVIQLDPRTMQRLSVFAPSTWAEDNQRDLDLGTSSPVVVPAKHRVVITGKRGVTYLLHPPFQGVGSAIDGLGGCAAFGGAAVTGSTVVMGCLFQDQVRALHVGKRHLRWEWTHDGTYGSPVVAGNHVYVLDRDSGDLVVLDLGTGRQLSRQHAGQAPHFPSQVVSGDWVFVPTLSGVTAFRGR